MDKLNKETIWNNRTHLLTAISVAFNIIFLCVTILLAYKFYPKIISKLSPDKTKTTEIKEAELKNTTTLSYVWYDASKFEVIGQLPDTKFYSRLPEKAKSNVRQAVWDLSKNAAGISIRFTSNTSNIKIRWTLNKNSVASNMTPIASKGFDLYAYSENKWQFVGVAKPTGNIQNESEVITKMETQSREYLLNLPLYDGVNLIEIGIDEGASISKPTQKIIEHFTQLFFTVQVLPKVHRLLDQV